MVIQALIVNTVTVLSQCFLFGRSEIISVRAERDKLSLEAQLAQEKLERFMKDFEHQVTNFGSQILFFLFFVDRL